MKKNLFFVCCFLFLPVFVYAFDAIDINTASLKELEELSGIGPVIGQRIIDARPFSSVDDLIRVSGIGEKTLQKIKDQGLAYVASQGSLPLVTDQTIQPVIKTATGPIIATNEPLKEASVEPAEARLPLVYPAGVVFNEILPSPEGADETEEWIEIFNQNNFEVDLSGWKIQDTKGSAATYIFPKNIKISGQGYLVLKRPETKIILNNVEDGLNLFSPDGKIIDSLVYDSALKNQSYNRAGKGWQWSSSLTPGAPLPTTQKSDNSYNSNKVADKIGLASISNEKKFIEDPVRNEISNGASPRFLFFFASIITVISGIIILILKVKLSKI